ncbi:unnamed protein product [Prorocentrum cordatum]|uniref:Uncharacterized protein n=1 Tax=Prorocentrum cordatum TaxID=2364126 RepID=A0ABN9PPP4_9DINO|nr:unnamed protein product [Polarella glacialis]
MRNCAVHWGDAYLVGRVTPDEDEEEGRRRQWTGEEEEEEAHCPTGRTGGCTSPRGMGGGPHGAGETRLLRAGASWGCQLGPAGAPAVAAGGSSASGPCRKLEKQLRYHKGRRHLSGNTFTFVSIQLCAGRALRAQTSAC